MRHNIDCLLKSGLLPLFVLLWILLPASDSLLVRASGLIPLPETGRDADTDTPDGADNTISGNIPADISSDASPLSEANDLEQQCSNLGLVLSMEGSIPVISGTLPGFSSSILEVPSGVVFIGTGAFAKVECLEEIRLPDSVVEIREDAFRECPRLKKIDLGGTRSVSAGAFYKCSLLEEIIAPKLQQTLNNNNREGAFAYCSSLKELNLPEFIAASGQCAFERCDNLESVSLPKATSLSNNTFIFCRKIKEFYLPEMNYLGYSALRGCEGLTSIELPKLTNLGVMSLSNCYNLKEVKTPLATRIGTSAFDYCMQLETLELPSAQTIEDWGFRGCYKLKTLKAPKLRYIEETAFIQCKVLDELIIPTGVNFMGDVFAGAPLRRLTLLNDDPSVDICELWLTERDKLADSGMNLSKIQEAAVITNGVYEDVTDNVKKLLLAKAYQKDYADYNTWDGDVFWEYCFSEESGKTVSVGGEQAAASPVANSYGNFIEYYSFVRSSSGAGITASQLAYMDGIFDCLINLLPEKTSGLPKSMADLSIAVSASTL